MYLIQRTKYFEKSFSKLKRSGIKGKVLNDIENVIDALKNGELLDKKYRDHRLHGDYIGYRECHIKADLLLVYQIQEKQLVLVLLDIGTHSSLFN